MRASSTSLTSRIWRCVGSLGSPCPSITTRRWRSPRCTWPPRSEAATSPAWSSTLIEAARQFSAELFETACRRLGIRQSMGRVGSCFDNAASESFHSTLEFELLRKHHFATKAQARAAVAGYINRYNRVRRHSTCEMH
jgi:transposase InsO family protein